MSHSISLNGAWKLSWSQHPDPIPAAVPGDVHQDICNSGLLPEPLDGDNVKLHGWIEEEEFTYTREFTLPDGFTEAELIFHGLDYFADISLDGKPVGKTANAHVPHSFDITGLVSPGSAHTLTVRLDSGVRWAKEQVPPEKYISDKSPERMFLRKSQFSFGWDWAPRLVPCGIWRDVEIRLTEGASIRDCLFRSAFEADDEVLVTADLTIRSTGAREAVLEFSVEGEGNVSLPVRLKAGENTVQLRLPLAAVERWYPAGYGAQKLYRLCVTLREGATVLDQYEEDYGFREVRIDRTPGADGTESFIITVNGIPVFCKGANWVPADSLPGRISDEKVTRLLEEAVDANMNMMRIWGGGIFESDTFYRECDRLGIMVWHDFLFACSEYPDDQPWFGKAVREEAEKGVKRLRHHPCITLWCGNNENDWIYGFYERGSEGKRRQFYGETLYTHILPEVCSRLDPDRPYWQSSPFGGEFPNDDETGDKHSWEVSILAATKWAKTDFRNYRSETGRFISEYGLLSYALPETILQYSGLERLDFNSEKTKAHDNTFNNGHTDDCIAAYYGSVPEDPEEYCHRSLAYQALGYREAITSFRMRKFDCAGSLFWMYSDCWGTHGWTVIDYYLRKKPSYYWVKKAYAPVVVFSRNWGPRTEVFIVNDTLEALTLDLTVERGSWDSRIEHLEKTVSVPANASIRAAVLYDSKGWVRSEIRKDGSVISEDTITAYFPAELPFPQTELDVSFSSSSDTVEAAITARGFAHFIRISLPDGIEAEDNYFNLIPGETKRISIQGCRPEDISISGLNVSRTNTVRETEKRGVTP